MQSPLVIFALGLTLLATGGCAVQELPFTDARAGSEVDLTEPQAAPYVPQAGAVHDGESGDTGYLGQNSGDGGFGTAPVGGGFNADPVPGGAAAYGSQASTPSAGSSYASPSKPTITTPSGLKEREL